MQDSGCPFVNFDIYKSLLAVLNTPFIHTMVVVFV